MLKNHASIFVLLFCLLLLALVNLWTLHYSTSKIHQYTSQTNINLGLYEARILAAEKVGDYAQQTKMINDYIQKSSIVNEELVKANMEYSAMFMQIGFGLLALIIISFVALYFSVKKAHFQHINELDILTKARVISN